MNPIDLRQKVSGRYKFKKVNKLTGAETELKEVANNLLLESFFREATSSIASGQGFMSSIVVGSGNTPPVVTNTQLQSFVAGTAAQQGAAIPNIVNSTVFPRYVTRAFTKRFNGTAIANIPLSEVGVAITTSGTQVPIATTPLASRALIVDTLGNPTSITVLADEFLDVTYEMTTYAMDGVTGSFDINVLGTVETFGYEIRPICMNNADSWRSAGLFGGVALISAKASPSAGSSATQATHAQNIDTFEDPSSSAQPPNLFAASEIFNSYRSPPAWDEASMTSTGILSLPLNNGNFPGGINSFLLNFNPVNTPPGNAILGMHRMMLDRPLMKTADHVFELPITLGLSNAEPPV